MINIRTFMEDELLKRTKIICTIGPASLQKEKLQKMYDAGMNGARINTAYGNFDQYKLILENIRETIDIPLILDIKGPEIRIRAKWKKTVKDGEVLEIGFNQEEISFNHNFYKRMNIDDNIYIDGITLFIEGLTDRVGIGTSSPAEKLHVAGDIRLDAGRDIAFADDNTRIHETGDDLIFEADDDIRLSPDDNVYIDGSTLFVNGSTNSVGIGTKK